MCRNDVKIPEEGQVSGEGRRVSRLTIGVLVGFLLLAGALASMPFLIRSPVPVVGDGAPASFSAGEGAGQVQAELRVDAANNFALMVAMDRVAAASASPVAVFEMPDHDMPPHEVSTVTVGPGLFRATGTLSMPGRWRMRIAAGDTQREFEFILREF